MKIPARPPYDPELVPALKKTHADGFPVHVSGETLGAARKTFVDTAENVLAAGGGGTHEERVIAGPSGDIPVSIFRPKDFDAAKKHPAILFYHPGGMIFGNRYVGLTSYAQYMDSCNAILITPEYHLAPEHPAPIEEAFATYRWVGDNLDDLCIDPERLLVAGISAGGCLTACVTLMARERGGPKLCGQILTTPMLDDRSNSVSATQYDAEGGIWSRQSNIYAWGCVLGSRSGTDDVKDCEAPARATDLTGVPPAYVECGSAEMFRDEDVAYATKLWAAGVQAELHIWNGGWHCFDYLAPTATVSKSAIWTRNRWVERLLNGNCAGMQGP